jgi:hypothetical protein
MGIWCAPVAVPWTAEQLQGDALEAARELSARALSLVDGHVCAHTSAASGRPQHLLAPLIQTGLFTAIVVPGEWAARPSFRRAARRWRRSGVELHAVWS